MENQTKPKQPAAPHGQPLEEDKKQHDKKGDNKGLSKQDIPEATNESTGATGSGQRQDSN